MAGRVQWEAQVDSNVAKLLKETKDLRDQLDGIKKGNYEIKLNIDNEKLEKVISNLDKMLNSLGKGTGDFKEFENLSKQLNEIVSEVKELNKAFGGINDSGVSNLLSSIQSIDKSLSSLSEHITNVNKDFGSVGKNASDNVSQINEARKATEGLTEATKELANAQKNVGNKSNISSGNTVSSSEVKNNEEVANAIRKKKEELASYELQVEELRYEIEKLSKTESESYGFKKAFPSLSDKQIDSFKERIYNSMFGTDKSRGYGLQKYLNMGKVDDESVIKSYRAWSEELDKVGYKLSELRQTSVGVEADIIPINGKAVTNAEEFRKVLFSISNAVSDVSSEKVVELSNQILELETKISSIKAEIKSLSSTSSTPIKDTFQGDTEASEMGKVATAVDEAVQAKKDFATANEDVQDSVDGSKSKLELETELMERLAKSAREAADAKKEFVEANKQVQGSVDDTRKSVKKDKYKNKSKISEDEYTGKSDYYASIANQKLKNSGNTILGETVSTELVDGLVKVTAKIKTADDTWKTFSAKIDADGNMFEQRFRTITKGVDKLETELKNFGLDTNPALSYGETLKKAEEIRSSLKLDDSYTIKVDSNELVTITQKLSDVKSSTTSVTQTFKSAQDAIEHFGKEASSSAEKTTVALKGVKASAESIGEAVGESLNFESIDKSLDKYNDKLRNFTVKPADSHRYPIYQKNIDDLTEKVSKLQTLRDNLSKKDINLISKEDIDEVNTLEKDIDELIFKMSKMSASEKGFDPLGADKALEKINSELKKNSAMSKEAKRQIQGFYDEIRSGNPSKPIKDLLDDMYKLIQAERLAGREGKSFMDIFKEKVVYGAAANLAGMIGIYDIINAGREGITVIRELDTALTEMRKVSDETVSSLERFQKASFDLADSIGTTALEVQNSTADFMRLGYTLEEASKLSQDANIYANVGDMNIDEATEHMISSIQAWRSEFDSTTQASTEIIDRYNKIGNEFAITSADIGSAMERTSAALKAGGNTLNESIGLITAGNLIQQDADTTANALKVMSLRIRGSKVELESMGETTDDLADSTSKLREQIKALTGVDIMLDDNTFKSTARIIQEIGAEWSKLTDISQSATLELLAGKTRASTVAGLIENYETINKVITAAENADGSALAENEKYLESIEGKIASLKNELQSLAYDLIDSGTIKDIIDAGKNIISIINKTTDGVSLLSLAIGGLSSYGLSNLNLD